MKKLNDRGFSALVILLVLVVIAVVGGAGYFVKQANQKTGKPAAQSAADAKPSTKPAKIGMENITILDSYNLPKGWKTLDCHPGTVTLLVPGQEDATCQKLPVNPADPKSQDFAHIGLVIRDINKFDTQSCANTIVKRGVEGPETGIEYDCRDVEVDFIKGIRQTVTHTPKSYAANGVPSVNVSYWFPGGEGRVLEAGYVHYPQSPYPDLTADFDDFVKSLSFK